VASQSEQGARGGELGTGFIAVARQRFPLFADARCAKLLFLAGMEMNACEERAQKALTAGGDRGGGGGTTEIVALSHAELLVGIHRCYELFHRHGAGRSKDLGEFITGTVAQRERLDVALQPATMFESCTVFHDADDRVANFAAFVVGGLSCAMLRMFLEASDRLRPLATQPDVDPVAPARSAVARAIAASDESFDFAPSIFDCVREDLLRNCTPPLSSTDVQIVMDAPGVVSAAVETALADRYVPLRLVQTIWRELLSEASASFKRSA
jgi:hypothetical protein